MPTYTYQCQKCENTLNVFHAMSANPRIKCPACGSTRMKRLLGTGAGIIFKGSGFYETDYKNNGKSASKTKDQKEAKTESPSESKSEPKKEKPAAKTSGDGSAA